MAPYSLTGSLDRLVSSRNTLKDSLVRGLIADLPEVGRGFRIITAAGDLIVTSKVEETHQIDDQTIEFMTKNSAYRLTLDKK